MVRQSHVSEAVKKKGAMRYSTFRWKSRRNLLDWRKEVGPKMLNVLICCELLDGLSWTWPLTESHIMVESWESLTWIHGRGAVLPFWSYKAAMRAAEVADSTNDLLSSSSTFRLLPIRHKWLHHCSNGMYIKLTLITEAQRWQQPCILGDEIPVLVPWSEPQVSKRW